MPRQGHLEAALHIMGYLKLKHNSRLAFSLSYLNIDHSNLLECDLINFYEGAVEAIPCTASLPRVEKVDLHMFVDSNNTGNKQTRRSKTRFKIYMNMSLTNWYSKKQSTIET